MSSTNKTSNYELSQFIGTDKPAWLGDYNTDMSKIDAQMKLNADGVTSASGSATSAVNAIGTLENLTTDAKSNLVSAINEVDSHADTAQSTANTANTTATTANTTASGLVSYLSMTNSNTLTVTASSTIGSVVNLEQSYRSAYNADGSLGKIYGFVSAGIGSPTGGNKTLTFNFSDTGLRPASTITINACIISYTSDTNKLQYVRSSALVINTDGTASCQIPVENGADKVYFSTQPFVIFAQDFGD